MNKRKLKLLDIAPFPALIETSQIRSAQKLKYVFVAHQQVSDAENILIVTFFSLETQEVTFRVFFDGTTFITERLNPERKWSQSTLYTIFSCWYGPDVAVCANAQSAVQICEFFHVASSPYAAMLGWQHSLRHSQLKVKHQQEIDEIDQRMSIVGELPSDFTVWVNEVALDFSRYIYYKRTSKRLIAGFCTSCGKQVDWHITPETPQLNIRHNQVGQCPLCQKSIIFKAVGKTTRLVDMTVAAVMQQMGPGFLLRSFKVNKEYNDHYRNPKLEIRELVREFYDGQETTCFQFAKFKQTQQIRWCYGQGKFDLGAACLYAPNVREVLAQTEFKYSGLYELAQNTSSFHIWAYLDAYIKYPAYEYLVKSRLYRLVTESIQWYNRNYAELDLTGKSTAEILGLTVPQIQQLQRLDGTVGHYKLIRAMSKQGLTLSDGQLETLLGMNIHLTQLSALLNYVTVQKVINYITRCLKTWPPIRTNIPDCSMSKEIAQYWVDYLQNCALLGYDLKSDFILFPRDLKARHDAVMGLVKANKDSLLDNAIQALYDRLDQRYSFAWKGFFIRPSTSAAEIIAEGNSLHHCVGTGSYIEDMAKGDCVIFLIRLLDTPDLPFFTVELRDGLVLQCRGAGNCQMTAKVKSFISEWKKRKLEPHSLP